MHGVKKGDYDQIIWYENIVQISKLPPLEKYKALTKLHDQTLANYTKDLQKITEEEAEVISSDGRSRKIIVAHIMGWEEFQTQVFKDEDPLARLRLQLNFQKYIDSDTEETLNFNNPQNNRQKSVDDFNAYHAKKYSNWSWDNVKQKAINTAQKLKSCFPDDPSEQWLSFLENTPPKRWKIKEGLEIIVPSGYYLWMVSLKHEAIEHRSDIAIIK